MRGTLEAKKKKNKRQRTAIAYAYSVIRDQEGGRADAFFGLAPSASLGISCPTRAPHTPTIAPTALPMTAPSGTAPLAMPARHPARVPDTDDAVNTRPSACPSSGRDAVGHTPSPGSPASVVMVVMVVVGCNGGTAFLVAHGGMRLAGITAEARRIPLFCFFFRLTGFSSPLFPLPFGDGGR